MRPGPMPLIRLADLDDTTEVARITDAAYVVYMPRLGRKPMPMLDDHAARIARGEVHLLEGDGGVLGLISLVEEPGALLIFSIAVAPRAQGRGIGKALIGFAEQQARQLGLPVLRLYTHVLMTENQAIYHHLGFVETERRDEGEFSRVFMEKRLSPA